MRSIRLGSTFVAVVVASTFWNGITTTVGAQIGRVPLPAEPLGRTGEAIYPALEGWGPHKDGSTVILLGYYNRNSTQAFDIPIGPDNQIEPGGPDYGQPTHFDPRQQHGVFAIKVPKDFGSKKLTWTLRVNGQATSVTFWLNPPYRVDFFKNAATGNEPPVVKFSPDGPLLTGPPLDIAQTLSTTVNVPVTLRLWASDRPPTAPGAGDELAEIRSRGSVVDPVAIIGDDTFGGPARGRPRAERPDITVIWKKHRGPGTVTFKDNRVALRTNRDPKIFREAITTASFDRPGEYILRAQIIDDSGEDGGGDQCCWTTAHVRVTVK